MFVSDKYRRTVLANVKDYSQQAKAVHYRPKQWGGRAVRVQQTFRCEHTIGCDSTIRSSASSPLYLSMYIRGPLQNQQTDLQRSQIYILAIGFLVNLVWENAQAFLYVGYRGFIEHFWTCFVASVIDALVILLVYLILALIYKDLYWPRRNTYVRYMVVALAGGTLALGFELWALTVGEWNYTGLMPVLPGLEVGLSPLIQLILLPILTYHIGTSITRM